MALEPAATEVSFRPVALGGAAAIFALIGATSSIYGPVLIGLAHRFHLSLPTAGAVLAVHFVGALLGVLLGWIGVKRLSGRTVLTVALLAMGLGALGAASAHHWTMLLACIVVVGIGYGALDFSLNALLTRTGQQGRARRLSVVNAGFGVGAVVGPLVVILLRPSHVATIFAGIAVTALLLTGVNRGVEAPPLQFEEHQLAVSRMTSQRRPILGTFIVAYIIYIAVETSTSGWMATHLHSSGYSQSVGSLVTAGFWLGVTVGRVAAGPLHRRISEQRFVLVGLGLAVVLGLIAWWHPTAPFAYTMLGLVLAAVFPMGLIWYSDLCPHDTDGIALMILLMMSGGVLGPSVESLMVSAFGTRVVPIVIAAFALLDLSVFWSARRFEPLILS